MKEELFDRKVKELVDSWFRSPCSGNMDRIEAGLNRHRRHVVWRRVLYSSAAAAVAAGLLAVSLLQWREPVEPAMVVQVAEPSSPSAEDAGTFRRVLEGIEHSSGLVAQAVMLDGRADRLTVRPSELKVGSGKIDNVVGLTEDMSVSSGRLPSIYDGPSVTEDNVALVAGEDQGRGRKASRLSFSAGGNLSPTSATGNVDFSQPNYSWGAAGSATSAGIGIVPISEPKHYFPVSVGLELKYSFLEDRLGVGLGVNYTFMHSSYEALVDRPYQAYVEQSLHYMGIPVNFYVNILSSDRLAFYANAGCMVERAVRLSYDVTDLNSMKTQYSGKAHGVQWSANVGLGLEYRFLDFMGLYVDPRLTYFFDCGQPYSVRTEQPLQFNLEMGFRFHIDS